MTTALNLYEYIQDSIDSEYSGYLDPARANFLIRESVIRVIEKIYSTNKTQKSTDELSPLTNLDAAINIRGNKFYTKPIRVSAATFVGTTVTLTVAAPHQLLVGENITIADVQGLNINGTYAVVSVPTTTTVTFIEPAIAGVYVNGTGNVTTGIMFPDMLHPLAIETTYLETLASEAYSITNVSTTSSPYHISIMEKSTIRTGSVIRLSGILGVVGANGDFYVKMRTRNTFYLFLDANFTQPAVLSGTYQGGGVARVVVKEWATRLHSDRRIAPSSDANAWRPKFGVTDNSISLYPTTDVCESVKVDYIRTPPITIDVNDNDIDLELYYEYKLLIRFKDEAVTLFMLRMRELQQASAEAVDANMNP